MAGGDLEEEKAFLGDSSSTESSNVSSSTRRSLSPLSLWPFPLNRYFVRRRLRRVARRPGILFSVVKILLVLLASIVILTPILTSGYRTPPPHYRDIARRCLVSRSDGCANVHNETVYVSVSLYDNTGSLAGGEWGSRLLKLIDLIGPNNVFLSVYENDSGAAGKEALLMLRSRLKINHKIVIQDHVSLHGFPTIQMPDGSKTVKRLAYLSEMRNRALRPLDEMNVKELGTDKFDKILFLNDVIFDPIEAANLLFSTNVGDDGKADYLAACGLDYDNPFLLYDVYAQRDAEGYSNGIPLFPYFSQAGEGISRAAMLRGSDAVPVKSCWGGMAAMRADLFYDRSALSRPEVSLNKITTTAINPSTPLNVTSPVRFRYEPEVFVDACECCLLMADAARVAEVRGSPAGIYVNPFIRNAYSLEVFHQLRWVQMWERLFVLPQWLITRLSHYPTHNPHRDVQEGDAFKEEIWVNDVGTGTGHWKMVERTARNGLYCLVRELQIIKPGDRGSGVNWQNVGMPPGQQYFFPT